MGMENPSEIAKIIIRSRISDPSFVFSFFSQSPDSNFSKLKYIISSSVTEACNNSVLLLGPRGCGKTAVLELVLEDLLKEHPDMITLVKLNGLLHSDNNCALKEIAKQLCQEHQLQFSKMASFDENSQFLLSILRECGLAHKTIVFVLEEFDLFTQGKQRLLYSLLDAMQSVSSQAVVVGVSSRLDADQLLEKRVRSRFSHRKLLFLPPSREELSRLVEHILLLPIDSRLPDDFRAAFNAKLPNKQPLFSRESKSSSHGAALLRTVWQLILAKLTEGGITKKSGPTSFSVCSNVLVPSSFRIVEYICLNITLLWPSRFLLPSLRFCAVCHMELSSGALSVENFKSALPSIQRQPKLEALKDCSVLELYVLVCMKRLEVKELQLCNFNSIMKEYKSIHDSFKTSDHYARNVCLRAFEHLLERGLISFEDNRGHGQSAEFRPVKLLISWPELQQGLKSHRSCPAILHKLMDREVRYHRMTLGLLSSKSLVPRKFLTSLCYSCSSTADYGFKLRFILVSHFHRNSELENDSSNGEGSFSSNGAVARIGKNIKSSNGLYETLILKTVRENPKAFRDNDWVVPDYCSALVADSDLLLSVINSIRRRPGMVLKIFRWAEGKKGFKHSEFVFCSVLEILVGNGLMSPAYWVVERVIDVNMEGVVDVLIDGFSNYEVSLKILDLILWVCTKKSDVERCLWVFDSMVKNGFLPDVKNCNRILRVLRDRDSDGKAIEFYELMGQFGIKPSIVTYNTMLDVFCRHGDVQEALDLLREMHPNAVTYNVLIDGLSKKGEIEKAEELIAEMLNKGLKLSVYSYNSLVSVYCHKGMLAEAIGVQQDMKMRGTLPNVSTYNALMHGYCKQGRVGHARQWIAVMLKKNMELDIISYNTLIYGYCLLGDVSEALFLLAELRKRGLNPTSVTFNTMIDGLCKIGDLEGARQMMNEMIRHGISPDIFTYTILMNTCYKMGSLSMAKEFYDEMLQEGLEPDCIAYATCIAGELKLGNRDLALKLQEEMLAKG
ncbi:origin recognition complex subunit 4 [Perilla frutescens var. hirtella]|uniref:Origin of replication complex subunit 4 n=1 Tax=Perilla frutescens var. hirtella TaxID=608512 RepID=A0AAD4IWR1_PERFH|nr:origin recognition complex subunit 4 [Perilla frutescens var. hirtella]